MTSSTRKRLDDADRDRRIDENLKRAFDEIANEPVPDRLTDLLRQLREGSSDGGGTQHD